MKPQKSNIVTEGLLDYLKETGQHDILPQITQQLQSMLDESDRVKEITINSSIELSIEQHNIIKKMVEKLLGLKLPIVNKIDKKLIAGLTIRIGDWFLDASILREIRELKKKLLI